jgi:hypothetical protein
MSGRRAGVVIGVLALAAVVGWVLFVALPRWTAPKPLPAPERTPTAEANPKIRAQLHYLSEDGLRLQPVDREIDFAEGPLAQGRLLLEALLQPAPAPLLSPIPPGTTLRGIYLSPDGVAFVDLSPEVSTAHPGGSLDEIFTVYSVVNTLSGNLPAIQAVQILVDGREVDTLAGHVDLRRPLAASPRWSEPPTAAEGGTAPEATAAPPTAAPQPPRP